MVLLPVIFSAGARGEGVLPSVGLLAAKSSHFRRDCGRPPRWVIPRVLHAVARSRSRELFTLSVFGLCAGVAFIGGLLELSLALGAFVAGVTVSESIFRHRILTEVLPLKNLFLTLFFMSIGLVIDVPTVISNVPLIVFAGTLALMLFKAGLVTVIGKWLGVPFGASLLGAAAISSAGEFSLVLLQRAGHFEPWPPLIEQISLSSIAISMALVPGAMRLSGPLAKLSQRLRWWRRPSPLPAGLKASERVKALGSRHRVWIRPGGAATRRGP